MLAFIIILGLIWSNHDSSEVEFENKIIQYELDVVEDRADLNVDMPEEAIEEDKITKKSTSQISVDDATGAKSKSIEIPEGENIDEQLIGSAVESYSNIEDATHALAEKDLGDILPHFDTTGVSRVVPRSDFVRMINGPLDAISYVDGEEVLVKFIFMSGADTTDWLHDSSCIAISSLLFNDRYIYRHEKSEFKIFRSARHVDEFLIKADPWYFQVIVAKDKPDDRLRGNLYRREGNLYPFFSFLKFYVRSSSMVNCSQ